VFVFLHSCLRCECKVIPYCGISMRAKKPHLMVTLRCQWNLLFHNRFNSLCLKEYLALCVICVAGSCFRVKTIPVVKDCILSSAHAFTIRYYCFLYYCYV
jgi:hypothetical protein